MSLGCLAPNIMSAAAYCAACGAEATATCNHCENQYCSDHITREAHNCLGEFSAPDKSLDKTEVIEHLDQLTPEEQENIPGPMAHKIKRGIRTYTRDEIHERIDTSESNQQSGYTPYHQREGGGLSPPPEKEAQSKPDRSSSTRTTGQSGNQQTSVEVNTSSGRFLAGAVIFVVGGLITLTGVGFFIGIPMGLLGFGIMFPRFTAIAVILAVISLFWLLTQV